MRFRDFLALAVCVVLSIQFIVVGSKSPLPIAEAKPTLIPPANLKFFTLGYSELAADLLWLRTIQDFDFCENKQSDAKTLEAFKCEKGWVFHMIDSVTELAPDFRQPYLSGAIMLTVLVNDIEGASAIFDKGVAKFPNDSKILFNAAYQALIEEKNEAKASRLLIEAGKNGAPPWVFALAARLQAKRGQLELAKATLENALASNPQGYGAERIQQRLDEVNAELAKQPKQ